MFLACSEDDNYTPFDHEGQAVIDDEALVSYLKTHYFNEVLDSIKEVDANQTPFYDAVMTEIVVENEITYNLILLYNYLPTYNDDQNYVHIFIHYLNNNSKYLSHRLQCLLASVTNASQVSQ